MSRWNDFKEWTKQAALSKPMRWLVSGITGLTFGGELLGYLLRFLPDTTFFIVVDTTLFLVASGCVARATSRGYTAIEEYIKKVDQQNLIIIDLKKEVRKLTATVDANSKMTHQLIRDDNIQNENNMNAYLQQLGIIRFCENIAARFPEEDQQELGKLLEPPGMHDAQGKNPPHLLSSIIIQAQLDSDPDSADELLEAKVLTEPLPLQTSNAESPGLISSFFAGAKSMYGTFWNNNQASSQIELSQNLQRQAFLDGINEDGYEPDLENPSSRRRSGSSNGSDPFSPPGTPPFTHGQSLGLR